MQTVIEVQGLSKSYGKKEVIKGINFQVNKQEILCFLGPNGAGKSTTINLLIGALKADSGTINHNNQSIHNDLNTYKSLLGIVPQDLAIYEELSAEKNINFFASLYGLKGQELKQACQFALEFCGLKEHAKDKVKTFSGGMKRRLNIACAIAHKPELLIMDEPTVGIDPQSRNHILEGVKQLKDQGMTILYTTHYMEEAEEIADRVIIMDLGTIITTGSVDSLKAEINNERRYQISITENPEFDCKQLYGIKGVKEINYINNTFTIYTDKKTENLDKIITLLINHKIAIKDINCQAANLETVFLKLTGKSLRD